MKLSINLDLGGMWTRTKSAFGSLAAWGRGDDVGGGGGAAMSNAYQQSVWVYACVSRLSEQVADVPWRLGRGAMGNESLVESGPMVDLFRRPHAQMDGYLFWELLTSWVLLRGEAFVVPVYDGNRLESLRIADPGKMRQVVEAGVLRGWVYNSGQDDLVPPQALLPDEVIHIRLANPYNFWRGMSPLVVASLSAETDYAASRFMRGLMLNNADTGVIVETEQQLAPEQREHMLAALRERKRQAGTADRPLLLWGGAKVVKPALSSTDMQFLENRKFSRQEICAVFGVPQEILGFTEDANRSVSDAARLNFIEHRVAPLCGRIASGINQWMSGLRGQEAGLLGWFDVDSLPAMQSARRARFEAAGKAFSGMGVPIGVCNDVFDLGLPELPHDRTVYLPYSLTALGEQKVGKNGTNGTDETNVTDAMGSACERLKGLLDTAAGGTKPATSNQQPATGSKGHRCKGTQGHEEDMRKSERTIEGKMRKFWWEQRGRALEGMTEKTNGTDGTNVTKGKKKPEKAEDLLELEAETAVLASRLKAPMLEAVRAGGARAFQELGIEEGFAVRPDEAIKYLESRAKMIKGINETTFDGITKQLQEGLAQGDTMEQLMERVKGVFSEASNKRSLVIAETESNIALNSGRMQAMTEVGVEKKQWLTSGLDNTRASHLEAEQRSAEGIPLGERFSNGLMYPGDPEGQAEEVINCRCTFAAVGAKNP